MRDALVEIHTEELPPKALKHLGESFRDEIIKRLKDANLTFKDADFFATPRRLAVRINELSEKQLDSNIERRGPMLSAAFQNGEPTKACIGFARSLGVEPHQLITIKNTQGEWVGLKQKIKGKTVKTLLPDIINQALANLPIPKRMRWNSGEIQFVRPVHSVILLYGNSVIPAEILGVKTGRKTRGHRFMSKGWLSIKTPADYVKTLEKAFVISDFEKRKNKILEEAKKISAKKGNVVIDSSLLDEVTGLVEWPVALLGKFDEGFLTIPEEALVAAMQDHQRYFPMQDNDKKLLPSFVTISNIESKNPAHVTHGNERVLRARLSDAAFFYETDKKIKLIDRVPLLKHILFQNKLGTLYDKTERIESLSIKIAEKFRRPAACPRDPEQPSWIPRTSRGTTFSESSYEIDDDLIKKIKKAATLCKTDLTTQMVGEFPELQGYAGSHYAEKEGIPQDICNALNEQYYPRFAKDRLPYNKIGRILAIADRLDTLVGIFGINLPPTGDKDPLGLRRAALGVLRILIEKKLDLNLYECIQIAEEGYANKLENKNTVNDVFQFMMERLKQRYQEQNISPQIFASVASLNLTEPYDIDQRIQAVRQFKDLPEAESLAAANKRVSNILSKYSENLTAESINPLLFEHDAEKILYEALIAKRQGVSKLSYAEILKSLASLREPVDNFFDKILVMTEDKPRRENRLLLLKQLRELFLHVADVALL